MKICSQDPPIQYRVLVPIAMPVSGIGTDIEVEYSTCIRKQRADTMTLLIVVYVCL